MSAKFRVAPDEDSDQARVMGRGGVPKPAPDWGLDAAATTAASSPVSVPGPVSVSVVAVVATEN